VTPPPWEPGGGATSPWPRASSPGQSAFDVAKRIAIWLLCGLTMLSGYGLTKLEPYGPPQQLALTWLDTAIPFLPWTVWIYGTASYAALIAFLQAPDRYEVRRLFSAVALAACTCWVFFAFFPTTYPRDLYPLADDGSWTYANFADLRGTDSPSNCLPSQHVALAWSLGLTWAAFLRRPWARALPILWAVAVSFTTLTTKQHYVWDVPTGFVVGAGAWAIVRWGVTPDTEPFWARWRQAVMVTREQDVRAIAALRQRVEAHQWSLDEIPWPTGPLPPLSPKIHRLISQVIYIEEIAGLNFQVLRDAAASDDLRRLYALFADEERRHADGLRHILALHGHTAEKPGLGNALVLDQFDTIDPRNDSDAILVACATPVFETFLDAGTIPFLQKHPAIGGPAFDAFVERVNRDEGAHIATNWIVTREMARQYAGWRGLRLLLNPNVGRGMSAVPALGIDVYALAAAEGFDFGSLIPAFGKIWRLHQRYPELHGFVIWQAFRLFVVTGVLATMTCIALQRARILFLDFWCAYTRLTDWLAWGLFGEKLLRKRRIPYGPPVRELAAAAK
jgi:hypothetical protein